MNTTNEKLVYSARDLASILGICLPQAYALMKRDDFPSVQLSPRRCVVPRSALDKWLAQQAGQEVSNT